MKEKRKIKTFDVAVYLVAFLLLVVVLYPLVYVLSASVSDPIAVAKGEVILFPKGFNLLGYQRVFQDSKIVSGYINTLFYTFFGTLVDLLVTVPAGYVLSKNQVPGRKIFTGIFMFIMYFSGGLIPTFLIIKTLNLYNTRLLMILLGAFSTYNCIICRTFFSSLPVELEEAAYIDGCSVVQTFVKIVLPLSKALLGVMVLYFAVAHWNSYFNALVYLKDGDKQPLQLVLRRILVLEQTSVQMLESEAEMLADKYKVAELIKYAVIVVSSLPLMIVYPFLQKFFEKGVMIGSVKG